MEELVMIGNGMAGVACLEQILKHKTKFDITIFGDETHANYNRILSRPCWPANGRPTTSPLTASTGIKPTASALRLGVRIVDVNSKLRTITGDDGSVVSYDKLIIATGSRAFIPPIDGIDKGNVFTFPQPGRHSRYAGARRQGTQGRRHRRRTAGSRSGPRPAAARLRRHRGAPAGPLMNCSSTRPAARI